MENAERMECPFNVDDGLRNHPDYTVREKKSQSERFPQILPENQK
jgi:hypothetical protein